MIEIDLIRLLAGGYFVLLAFLFGAVVWQLFKNKKILDEVASKADADSVDSVSTEVKELKVTLREVLSNQEHYASGLSTALEGAVEGIVKPFAEKIEANESVMQEQIRENGRILNKVLLKLQE